MKKSIKKAAAILLASIMTVGILGCGGNSAESGVTDSVGTVQKGEESSGDEVSKGISTVYVEGASDPGN